MGTAATNNALDDGGGASVRILRPLAAHLLSRGCDVAALFASEGVTPAGLFDSNARLSHAKLVALWRRAEEITGDPHLGLRALDVADFRLMSVAGEPSEYVMIQLGAASATVGEALARWERYYGIAQLDAKFAVERRANDARVTFTIAPGLARARSYVECCAGALVRLIQGATDGRVVPRRIFFRHAAPERADEYTRAFGAPVSFGVAGEADAGFELAKRDLRAPLVTSQPSLIALLEKRADAALERAETRGVVARVRAAIGAELVGGNPSAEQVAARLATPVRTLSRRLARVGTSYRDVLDEVRSGLARRYLTDERRSVTETATLLGFADPSSFARAFKRWFDEGPPSASPSHASTRVATSKRVAEKVGRAR